MKREGELCCRAPPRVNKGNNYCWRFTRFIPLWQPEVLPIPSNQVFRYEGSHNVLWYDVKQYKVTCFVAKRCKKECHVQSTTSWNKMSCLATHLLKGNTMHCNVVWSIATILNVAQTSCNPAQRQMAGHAMRCKVVRRGVMYHSIGGG
jgi:hypothetical protein